MRELFVLSCEYLLSFIVIICVFKTGNVLHFDILMRLHHFLKSFVVICASTFICLPTFL